MIDLDLDACLRLLDDPDETVGEAVRQKLHDMGREVLPSLRATVESTENELVHQRAVDVEREFRIDDLTSLILLVLAHKRTETDIDLQEALVLLNGFGRPEDDRTAIADYLDALALRVHEKFIAMHPANDLTQLMALHTILYDEEGFHGAVEEYYDTKNGYLSSVIARRTGVPVSLAVIELLLAERTGLDIRGVALPYHFVVYVPEVDIYVDAFHGGTFLSREDCRTFIQRSGLTFDENMLRPVKNLDIVVRILRNLSFAHARAGEIWEAETLRRALYGIEQKPSETE